MDETDIRYERGPSCSEVVPDGQWVTENVDSSTHNHRRNDVYVRCPTCCQVLRIDERFEIDDSGVLSPCMWCKECDVHVWTRLKDWSPGERFARRIVRRATAILLKIIKATSLKDLDLFSDSCLTLQILARTSICLLHKRTRGDGVDVMDWVDSFSVFFQRYEDETVEKNSLTLRIPPNGRYLDPVSMTQFLPDSGIHNERLRKLVLKAHHKLVDLLFPDRQLTIPCTCQTCLLASQERTGINHGLHQHEIQTLKDRGFTIKELV